MKQRAWRRNEKVKHEPQHMNDRSPLRLIWLLLLVPYVGLLWVPFYNARTPELWGFPFFYWYQLIWVPITATLTWLVYRSEVEVDVRQQRADDSALRRQRYDD